MDRMGTLMEMDQAAYDQYRDQVSDYQKQLEYYKDKYRQQQEQEYEAYLDRLKEWQENRDYSYEKAQDQQEQSRWEEKMRRKWAQLYQ